MLPAESLTSFMFCFYNISIDNFLQVNNLTANDDNQTFNYTDPAELEANPSAEPTKVQVQLVLSSSGYDEIIYYFDEKSESIQPLTNESSTIIMTSQYESGIMTILDTTSTIAISISYNMVIVPLSSKTDEVKDSLSSGALTGIIVGSPLTFLVLMIAGVFVYKCHRNRKESFALMMKDLNSGTIITTVQQSRVKISDQLVSPEFLRSQLNSGQSRRDHHIVTVEDLRRRSNQTPSDNPKGQDS